MTILETASRWLKRRQTCKELSRLSDATLLDIGLQRSDIRTVVESLTQVEEDGKPTQYPNKMAALLLP